MIGHLRADVRTLSYLEGESYNKKLRELALAGRTLEWKVEKLALNATGGHWGLARGTDEVTALTGLSQHRNRIIHMERHEVNLPGPGFEQLDPPPEGEQQYEVGRWVQRITGRAADGSVVGTWEATGVLQDPWRAVPISAIRRAEAAFREMRIQYDGATGDEVGHLKFPRGPIWKEREPR